MTIIQIILLFSFSLFGVWIYTKDFVPWLKLLAILFMLTGGYFVIFPNQANQLANILHVGRGADLMLYFFVVIFAFLIIALYQKLKVLENHITKLTREKAKKEGIKIKD